MNELLKGEGVMPWLQLVGSGPGALAFYLLVGMSLLCWYQICHRIGSCWWRASREREIRQQFVWLQQRQQLPLLLNQSRESAQRRLMRAAWHCWQEIQKRNLTQVESGPWLEASIGQQLEREKLRLESGLTLLACIGACAPFVDLFGTVWGIVHALQSIAQSGQSTLDKVAGPVGEALIMTGIGLLVALPAVLAYNGFVRLNRRELAGLTGFANELYALLACELPLMAPDSRREPTPTWLVAGAVA